MTSMMHICAGMGPKSRKNGTCADNTDFCDVFKIPLEAHEAKENKTNGRRSDPSTKKVMKMIDFLAVGRSKKCFFP